MKGVLVLVKAIYENNVLKPLEKLDLEEGDVVEIEVKKSPVDQLYGLIKIQNKEWLDEIIESPDLADRIEPHPSKCANPKCEKLFSDTGTHHQ